MSIYLLSISRNRQFVRTRANSQRRNYIGEVPGLLRRLRWANTSSLARLCRRHPPRMSMVSVGNFLNTDTLEYHVNLVIFKKEWLNFRKRHGRRSLPFRLIRMWVGNYGSIKTTPNLGDLPDPSKSGHL